LDFGLTTRRGHDGRRRFRPGSQLPLRQLQIARGSASVRRADKAVGHPGGLDAGLVERPAGLEGGHFLLNGAGISSCGSACHLLVVGYPVQDTVVRLVFDPGVGEAVTIPHGVVIMNDLVVHYGSGMVVLDDVIPVDVGDSHVLVIVNPVEMVLLNDDRLVGIAVAVDVDIGDIDIINHNRSRSPAAVTIVGFEGSQRNPADIDSRMDPPHAAWIPAKAEAQEGPYSHLDAHDRRCPVPEVASVHPVAIVVGHVAERLIRNPALVAVVGRPSTGGERGPPGRNGGAPERPIAPFVVDLFPPSVLIEGIGLIMQAGREVAHRFAAHFRSFGPELVALAVPVIPVSVDIALARGDLLAVGDHRGPPGGDFVPGLIAVQDQIDLAFQGDDFERPITDVEIKHAIGRCYHITERRGCADDTLGVPVVEPCHAGGNVGFGEVRAQSDELDLGAAANPDPGIVGHNEFRFTRGVGIEGILQAEGGIPDRCHPVLLLGYVPEQLTLDVGNAAHQGSFSGFPGGGGSPGRPGCRKHQHEYNKEAFPQRFHQSSPSPQKWFRSYRRTRRQTAFKVMLQRLSGCMPHSLLWLRS